MSSHNEIDNAALDREGPHNNKNDRNELLQSCAEIAHSDSILDLLDMQLKGEGYAGSTNVPQLVFLCTFTRFLDQLVSLVIKGPSGCGKSYALKSGLKFVPEAAYELYHGMSERALIYNPNLDLRHKHLVIQEAAGLSKGVGRTFLRQLLSEGKVRYATVQNTKDGLEGKDLPPLEGPAGLMMTTTANALHPEDESRMFSVQMDESFDRIHEAMRSQARSNKKEISTEELRKWHCLHEYVGSGDIRVSIPYADALVDHMPVSSFRVMRDFPQVLSLLSAHALMHQCTRDQSEDGKIISTIDDYRHVYRLIHEPLSQGLEVAVPKRIREVVDAVCELTNQTHSSDKSLRQNPILNEGISQTQLAENLKRDQSVVSRNVREAVFQGYLSNLNSGQGREAKIVLGERKLPSGSALPTPEELDEADKSNNPEQGIEYVGPEFRF